MHEPDMLQHFLWTSPPSADGLKYVLAWPSGVQRRTVGFRVEGNDYFDLASDFLRMRVETQRLASVVSLSCAWKWAASGCQRRTRETSKIFFLKAPTTDPNRTCYETAHTPQCHAAL